MHVVSSSALTLAGSALFLEMRKTKTETTLHLTTLGTNMPHADLKAESGDLERY